MEQSSSAQGVELLDTPDASHLLLNISSSLGPISACRIRLGWS